MFQLPYFLRLASLRRVAFMDSIKITMINGLCSEDPMQKAYWKSIPCEGDTPMPEEFIAYTAKVVRKQTRREKMIAVDFTRRLCVTIR